MWTSGRARCWRAWSAARWTAPGPRHAQAGSPPLPETDPGQRWEVDASLVDPEGLVARATGATNGSKRTSGPGIAAVAAWLPERVVENEELAGPLGVDADWIASRTGIQRRRRVSAQGLVDLAAGAGAQALALARVPPAQL